MFETTMIEDLLAPISLIIAGFVIGILLTVPVKKYNRRNVSAFVGWAVSSAVALWLVASAEYQYLANFYLFKDFSGVVNNTQFSRLVMGDLGKTTIATLIGLYEAGLILGFASLSEKKDKTKAVSTERRRIEIPERVPVMVQSIVNGSNIAVTEDGHQNVSDASIGKLAKSSNNSNYPSLDRDERTVAELFLFGNTKKIKAHADVSKPEGYYFEGIPSMKIETSKLRRTLDSLVRRNIVISEIDDKMLLCKDCGSPNLQLKSMCPECKSMTLTRHTILEHFSCGLIDRQESFRTPSGDLVCPKCNSKLHLIGSDYRSLSQMYVCSECKALNKDLLQLMKCGGCGSISRLDEESEEYLYSYTLNDKAAEYIGDQIKPIEVCSNWFKSLGYVVVAPAFVSGKSGTSHMFDLLVLHSDSKNSENKDISGNASGKVIEILVSSKLVEIGDVTRVYGKICDVDCESLILAIPGLTSDARTYAQRFGMNVLEGQSLDEAFRRSRFVPVMSRNESQQMSQ